MSHPFVFLSTIKQAPVSNTENSEAVTILKSSIASFIQQLDTNKFLHRCKHFHKWTQHFQQQDPEQRQEKEPLCDELPWDETFY